VPLARRPHRRVDPLGPPRKLPKSVPVYFHHELIHIHIPKTGGTAIGQAFERLGNTVSGRDAWVGRSQHDGRWFELQHLTWRELRHASGPAFDGWDSFAVVRDPCQRLLSDFLWRQRILQRNPATVLPCFDSLRDFVAAIPEGIDTHWDELIDGAPPGEANFLIHTRPQHHYLFDPTGARSVSHVLRFERLGRDFGRLLEAHGASAPEIRTPTPRELGAYYDRELLDRVHDLYAADFRLLGYERT